MTACATACYKGGMVTLPYHCPYCGRKSLQMTTLIGKFLCANCQRVVKLTLWYANGTLSMLPEIVPTNAGHCYLSLRGDNKEAKA